MQHTAESECSPTAGPSRPISGRLFRMLSVGRKAGKDLWEATELLTPAPLATGSIWQLVVVLAMSISREMSRKQVPGHCRGQTLSLHSGAEGHWQSTVL